MSVNPDKIKQVKDIGRPDILFCLARLPSTNRFFVGSSDFKIYEVDPTVAKPEFKPLGSHASYVSSVALAGKTLVSASFDGRLNYWDTNQRTQIRSTEAHSRWIRQIAVSPSGNQVASVADDMVCKLWDAQTGKLIRELQGHDGLTPHHYPSMLYACTFSGDGKHLATADKVGKVMVWEVDTGKKVASLEAPIMYTWDPDQRRHSIGGIRSLAFSPDHSLLAVGGMGKVGNIDHLEGKARVEIFDWKKGTRTHEFPGDRFNGLVNRFYFHPKNEWLMATGGANDGFLIFFDLATKKILRQEKVGCHVHDAVLNDDGDTIWLAGHHHLLSFEIKG